MTAKKDKGLVEIENDTSTAGGIGSPTPEEGAKVSTNVEHWWSATASSHRVLYLKDNISRACKFTDHVLIIDPENDPELSKVLNSRVIAGIYKVSNKPYPEGKERNAFMDYLYRTIMPDGEVLPSGIKKVRGLFTMEEMVSGGVSSSSDYKELIGLAITRKSLEGLGFS
jgi:hypothetical protein